CSVDKAVASFHGLQPGLQRRRGSLGSTRLQRSVKQLPSCKEGSEPCRARASRSGAPKGLESRAANGYWSCSGSKSCRGRSRQRKTAGECEGEGATTLNVERQDAANVVWAARAAEVGRTGSRGAQSPDCRRLAKPECRGKKKPQITREK
ncbi:hypothetical protein FOFC_13644, partial [Fusarium oxysporum]